MASLDPKFVLGPGALRHLNTAPRVPGVGRGTGRDPIGSYFTQTNTRTIELLGSPSLSRNTTQETPWVLNRKRDLLAYLDYLQRCKAYYGDLVPKEFYNARETLFRGLRKIFHQEFIATQRLFTNREKRHAKLIYDWAQNVDVAPDRDEEVSDDTTALTTSTANSSDNSLNSGTQIQPPTRHDIWGTDGIMFGLALSGHNRSTYTIDHRYLHMKRSGYEYGHNGFEVGAWFPRHASAFFFGAHCQWVAGIGSSSADKAAYSVIVGGAEYEGLDEDQGDTIYYSAPGSHKKRDGNVPPPRTAGTLALRENCSAPYEPVRVLRKAAEKNGRGSVWAPKEGLRYDGLYRVVGFRRERTRDGSEYEQFELQRLENQKPLSELRKIPNKDLLKDFYKIDRRF